MVKFNGTLSYEYQIGKNSDSKNSNVIAAGKVEEISEMLSDEKTWNDPVEAIEKMIKTEAKFHPNSVGEPIDIIELTTKGLTRKRNSGLCK